MPTKPSLEATRWATAGTNNDPPSSGQRDSGWTPGQTGVSDYDNALKKGAYDWFSYLNSHAGLDAQTIELAGADWRSIRGTNTLDADGLWTCDATGFELIAPLVLPAGIRIDNLTFNTKRSSASPPAFEERLFRRAAGTGSGAGSASAVIDTFPALSTVNWVAHDIINVGGGGSGGGPGAHVVASGYRYWVSISLDFDAGATGTRHFDGVKVVVSWP